MATENSFNLADAPWIPVADIGLVSLRQMFSHAEYRALGGNAVQKIAVTKLLLAIAQAAAPIADNDEWAALGAAGLARACLTYLDRWHDRFYLYGERPFLQMPGIARAAVQSFGAVQAEVSSGNTTVLTQSQVERPLSDADKALLLVQLMGFGMGGKKTDNSVVLSPAYQEKTKDNGKPTTGKAGASLGFLGFLHNFLQGKTLHETVWLNLFSTEQIAAIGMYPDGIGIAPWQKMPEGENCPVAARLKSSLMGRLVPMSRFCLLTESALHYSEGLAHAGYKEGVADPSVSINFSGKDPKALWADPEKRPWRLLTALLSFFSQLQGSGFECPQLRLNLQRALPHVVMIGVWSGGLRVSSNAGEQYVSGANDFVESIIELKASHLDAAWFTNLQLEMTELDNLSKAVYGATYNYFKSQNMDAKDQAALAGNLFWQLSERRFSALVEGCSDPASLPATRREFAHAVRTAYDNCCARDTARQIDAWAKNLPNLSKYVNAFTKEPA